MISAIVAVAKNGVIGKSNGLPWYLPADLKHFSQLTTGHAVIVGQTTFESIVARLGHGLPNRLNIVLTRDESFTTDYGLVALSLDRALELAGDQAVFVIGGAQIYALTADRIQRWYLTEVDAEVDGDVMLKGFDRTALKEISRELHQADDKNPYNYSFVTYERQ